MTIDEQLIIRLCDRDFQSINELYDRYENLLWNMTYRTIKDEAICEEIIKRIFHDIWKNPHTYKSETKLSILMMRSCKTQISHFLTLPSS